MNNVIPFPQPKPCTVDYLRVNGKPFTSLWAAESYAREVGAREIWFVAGKAAELSLALNVELSK